MKLIDRERLFRYSRGIIEMKVRHHETELLAGPEGGLLLNLAQQMVLYLCKGSSGSLWLALGLWPCVINKVSDL